jgi:hypothetical protein
MTLDDGSEVGLLLDRLDGLRVLRATRTRSSPGSASCTRINAVQARAAMCSAGVARRRIRLVATQ